MYKVLMPIDDSEARVAAQIEAVSDLPTATEAIRVYALHVFDTAEAAAESGAPDLDGGTMASERLADAGITTEFLSRHGDPSEEILSAAEDTEADMILLGGRKRSPLGSMLFGSVSQEVMLDAARPVVITGGTTETAEPTHQCPSCGEKYYTDPGVEITTCRNCGGAKVEPLA